VLVGIGVLVGIAVLAGVAVLVGTEVPPAVGESTTVAVPLGVASRDVNVPVGTAVGEAELVPPGVGVPLAPGVGVPLDTAVGVAELAPPGVSVPVAPGVVVPVATGVPASVGVGVTSASSTTGPAVTSVTMTSSIAGPHGPGVVLLNVSRVVLPLLGDNAVPRLVAVQPILVGLWPATSNENEWLDDPNDTFSVLLVGEPKQVTMLPAALPASANETEYRCPACVGMS
jgi:hypothetical protein